MSTGTSLESVLRAAIFSPEEVEQIISTMIKYGEIKEH